MGNAKERLNIRLCLEAAFGHPHAETGRENLGIPTVCWQLSGPKFMSRQAALGKTYPKIFSPEWKSNWNNGIVFNILSTSPVHLGEHLAMPNPSSNAAPVPIINRTDSFISMLSMSRQAIIRFQIHLTLTYEWVKWLSRVRLFATPWTVAYQAPPSMEFSRQECWSGLPFPSPGDLPDPGIKPGSPALQIFYRLSH